MVHWHVTPEYINNYWTNEELDLMVRMHNEAHAPRERQPTGRAKRVSDQELFALQGVQVKTVYV